LTNVLSFSNKDKGGTKEPESGRKLSFKDEAKRQEYLLLNYPADVRRNLRSISGLSFDDDEPAKAGKAQKPEPKKEPEKKQPEKGSKKGVFGSARRGCVVSRT